MPSAATIEAARPKCPGAPVKPNNIVKVQSLCGQPLTWDDPSETWVCRIHGQVLAAQSAAARWAA